MPAKPQSDIACYFALSLTSGLINNIKQDKTAKAPRYTGLKAAGPSVNFIQQWYLARLSTLPAEQWNAEAAEQARQRIYKTRTSEQLKIGQGCMRWGYYMLHNDYGI